ncbi:MAG: hypothetical protein PVSMB1_16750 [Gemmatimonadaceae bacterium]
MFTAAYCCLNAQARTASKTSDAMSNVLLPQALQPWVTPERASVLQRERHVTHRTADRAGRFVLGHARAMEITLRHLTMKLQLFGTLALGTSMTAQIGETAKVDAHVVTSLFTRQASRTR